MATTATLLESKGNDMRVFDVTIDSADTSGSVTHGCVYTPEVVIFTPKSAGVYSQTLIVATVTATVVTFTKGGAAAASFLLYVGRSYSPGSRFTN